MSDLLSSLAYVPQELRFGTSGRRGRVPDLTQLEIYINVSAELEYLLGLPRSSGGIARDEDFYFGYDLRPSSTGFDDSEDGRGEICQAVVRSIQDAGLHPVNLGPLPTPALAFYAQERNCGSIMVTGSHIPFDLNGYKLNTSAGELMKEHEGPIGETVRRVRDRICSQGFSESMFDAQGMFRDGHRNLPPIDSSARDTYVARYRNFFADLSLAGKRILVYQHSAVGRDLLVDVLEGFGADAVSAGRSDGFVAIDTEAIDDAQLAMIQSLVDQTEGGAGLWAVVSTDGDSDRPMILGMENGKVHFFAGDLAGMVVAEYLGADAVVVPVSCNDAIDRGPLSAVLEPKTRIGSPWVIAGMAAARARGRKVVCGWEANGGFLLGSDVTRGGKTLRALPTRDAILPILAVLFSAKERNLSLPQRFAQLPPRYSRAALLRNFPRTSGRRIVEELTAVTPAAMGTVKRLIEEHCPAAAGFSPVSGIDYTDGVRVTFRNGEVVHLRPSGNADEFRVYAVADTQARASAIVEMGVSEPDGIVRRLERTLLRPSV